MIIHPSSSVLFVAEHDDSKLQGFFSYLESISHIRLAIKPQLPQDLSPYDVIVTANTPAFASNNDHLKQFVHAGGGWLELVHLSDEPLPQVFGAKPGPIGPDTELRVLFHDRNHSIAKRLPDAIYVNGCYQSLALTNEDTE